MLIPSDDGSLGIRPGALVIYGNTKSDNSAHLANLAATNDRTTQQGNALVGSFAVVGNGVVAVT